MAIQNDFSIDVVLQRITYTTAFVNDRPPSIYTVNELYSYLQDTFDEPGFMQYSVPMSAQTPTQYTIINTWFIDDNSVKALYGGSIQTSGWLKSGASGITQIRWKTSSSDPPVAGDIGVVLTGGTSTATGRLLAVNTTRQVAWVRNTSSAQFSNNENITGTGVNMDSEVTNGVQTGETIWANLFSVGSKAVTTEIYVGQEDDFMGGQAYHGTTAADRMRRRIEKVDEWWDVDVDFATGSPNLLGGTDHFDILMKTQEANSLIDSGRLFVGAREFGRVYSHFEVTAAQAGNFVVPFASTGSDINNSEGPYTVAFDGRSGTEMLVGDVLENGSTSPVGRLRAIVTDVTGGASATGTIEFYLIGENEPLTTTDRTLKQLANNDNLTTRGASTNTFDVNGTPTQIVGGPADDQGIVIDFGNAQRDINEDSTDEEYACVVNCNNIPLQDVYQYVMFLTCQGNQDGTTPNVQDELLPTAVDDPDGYEPGEFYRAVGDITVPWDSKTGSPPREGKFVTNANSNWTASGVVVALSNPGGASGQLTLTQVKGTWSNNDPVAEPNQFGSNQVLINGTPSSITDNTGAPFGTFAGGRWFVARGVVLDNVPAADANNWETVDLGGTRIAPPTQRSITFAGFVANDRGALFEVSTPGGDNITKNQNGVGAAGAAAGNTTIPLDTTVALDVPATNSWIRIVDVSSTTGEEFRYFFTTVSGTTVTLDTGAGTSGTATSAGSSTVLNDTGAFTNFGTVGNLRVGMHIRNTTDGSRAIVLRKIDNDSIETTPLTGGSDNTWQSSDTWDANRVVVALVDADTVYFPFIDDVASGSTLTATIKFVSNTDLIARARFSDPDVGGTRILPFEQKGITLTDANLTVTAIRTTDTIASP